MAGIGQRRGAEYDAPIKAAPSFGRGAVKPSRLNRKRWWLYTLAGLAAVVVAYIGAVALLAPSATGEGSEAASGLTIVAWLGYVIFQTNLNARRFHDIGMSGWHAAWGFIPMIGSLIMVGACGFPPGEDKTNKWGAPRI